MKIVFTIIGLVLLIFTHSVAYSSGQAYVRRNTIVRSGFPYYYGKYYGECAFSGVPGQSSQYCATRREITALTATQTRIEMLKGKLKRMGMVTDNGF